MHHKYVLNCLQAQNDLNLLNLQSVQGGLKPGTVPGIPGKRTLPTSRAGRRQADAARAASRAGRRQADTTRAASRAGRYLSGDMQDSCRPRVGARGLRLACPRGTPTPYPTPTPELCKLCGHYAKDAALFRPHGPDGLAKSRG
jgi:hypothetical protein